MSAKQAKLFCTRCDDEAHENAVEGKKFYYCRTCKIEVYSPATQPRKSDVVAIGDLQYFYTGLTGQVHCGHCTAKQGEAHFPSCKRNTKATLELPGQLEFYLDKELKGMFEGSFDFISSDDRKSCQHTATYASGDIAYCLQCQKDLS